MGCDLLLFLGLSSGGFAGRATGIRIGINGYASCIGIVDSGRLHSDSS